MRAAISPIVAVLSFAVTAQADGIIRVPQDHPTIQKAVDAAPAGATIKVGHGEHCGATIDREVQLVGHHATIVGCAAPLVSGLAAGFLLAGPAASGTTIRGFSFDGECVGDDDLDELAFAVFGRDADDVTVKDNRIEGTVQGVTNTGGDRWLVSDNEFDDLTAFTCQPGGRCGGGNAIVFQQRDPILPPGADNVALDNRIDADVPEGLDAFVMTGVYLQGQLAPLVADNSVRIDRRAGAAAYGVGVLVDETCCGDPLPLPPTREAQIRDNRVYRAGVGLGVTAANLIGLVVSGNRGDVEIGTAMPPLEDGPSSLLPAWLAGRPPARAHPLR
jgi:hypothetical protein